MAHDIMAGTTVRRGTRTWRARGHGGHKNPARPEDAAWHGDGGVGPGRGAARGHGAAHHGHKDAMDAAPENVAAPARVGHEDVARHKHRA